MLHVLNSLIIGSDALLLLSLLDDEMEFPRRDSPVILLSRLPQSYDSFARGLPRNCPTPGNPLSDDHRVAKLYFFIGCTPYFLFSTCFLNSFYILALNHDDLWWFITAYSVHETYKWKNSYYSSLLSEIKLFHIDEMKRIEIWALYYLF